MPDIQPRREQEPSFDDIRRSDNFIEALANGRPVAPVDASDAALAELLGGWRDEMRWPPATGLISEPQAIAALNAGLAEKPSRGVRERRTPDQRPTPERSRRGLSVVGAAAAAVLCIGGVGAVVAGAGPGDSLYGLRTMLFGAPKEVRDDQVALAARTEMQQVQELISQGDWQQAQEKLVAVSSQVESIGDTTQKQELLEQFNDLSAKVVERDPAATAPPGIVYTVPPSATELVPAVAPPTTPTDESGAPSPTTTTPGATTSGATTSGATTSGATTSAESSAPSTSSGSTSPSPAAGSSAPSSTSAPSTSAAPSTTAAPSTSAAPSSAGTSAATSSPAPAQAGSTAASTASSAATAATTSAAPRSATTTTTTAAPTTTSAAPAQAATTTAAAKSADQTAAPTTAATAESVSDPTAASAPAPTTAPTAQSTAAPSTVPSVVITTTTVPVPEG